MFLFPQKSDSDLIFEDGLGGSLSDDESSRTKLVSKRASDDSDKQTLGDSQIESDSGWLGRIKRSLTSLWTGPAEEVVAKMPEESQDLNKSQDSFEDFKKFHTLSRMRRQSDTEDDEDDDEGDENSGDDEIIQPSTSSSETASEALAPVKDDKFCESRGNLHDAHADDFFFLFPTQSD